MSCVAVLSCMKVTMAGRRGPSNASVRMGYPSMAVVNQSHGISLLELGPQVISEGVVSFVIFSNIFMILLRMVSIEIVTSALSSVLSRWSSSSSGRADLIVKPVMLFLWPLGVFGSFDVLLEHSVQPFGPSLRVGHRRLSTINCCNRLCSI